MKNKIIVILSILLTLFILFAITNYIDGARVRTGFEPRFTVKVINETGNKITYWGLGYKVIRYLEVSPEEPWSLSPGVRMGSWFMNYELEFYDNIEIELLIENKTVVITGQKDIEYIHRLVKDSKYIFEICDGIISHKIIVDKEVYYVKDGCREIQKGNKQAKVSDEDFETFEKLIKKYC